jgi:integrase
MTGALRRLLETQHAEHMRLKREGRIVPQVFFRPVAKGRGGVKYPKPIIAFGKAWKTACVTAGCPDRIPHDLRRTAAAVRNLVPAGTPSVWR